MPARPVRPDGPASGNRYRKLASRARRARLAPWLRYLPARFPDRLRVWPGGRRSPGEGVLTGHQLRPFPMQTVSWGQWRAAHPEGWVLSRDTGYTRAYGANPYPGYDDIHSRRSCSQAG